jgi:cytochrome c peroxidase
VLTSFARAAALAVAPARGGKISARSLLPLVAVLLAVAPTACSEPDETPSLLEALKDSAVRPAYAPEKKSSVEINPRLLRRFEPVRSRIDTPANVLTSAKMDLGRMLFFEKRLSKNQELSCNTCHQLANYGVDNQPTSTGHHGHRGGRNAPTVYNAAGFFAEFWDGRAGSVEQQAIIPMLDPTEMAMSGAAQADKVLKSMPEYLAAFKNAFPGERDPVTIGNIGLALGAFERRLTTPSRWDEYLRGNQSALTDPELEGLKAFTNIGCMVCHTGEFLGGGMYQKVGVVEPWPNQKDQGRYEVTKQEVDRMMFKVPTLRNIAKTAPYFHDGSVPTLDAAVRRMGRYQLGLNLADREVSTIVAWLGALTGRLPDEYIKPPKLPESGPQTPGPDPN